MAIYRDLLAWILLWCAVVRLIRRVVPAKHAASVVSLVRLVASIRHLVYSIMYKFTYLSCLLRGQTYCATTVLWGSVTLLQTAWPQYAFDFSLERHSGQATFGIRDFILFSKAPQQGVEIKAVLAAGPSLGIVAPYYIERAVDNSFFTSQHEQYDPNNPNHSFNNILGTGNLFEGIGDSKLQLGANVKAALNFELGFLKSQVTGFEVGVLVDSYFNKIILMPTAENKSVFPTVFFTLFYGTRK